MIPACWWKKKKITTSCDSRIIIFHCNLFHTTILPTKLTTSVSKTETKQSTAIKLWSCNKTYLCMCFADTMCVQWTHLLHHQYTHVKPSICKCSGTGDSQCLSASFTSHSTITNSYSLPPFHQLFPIKHFYIIISTINYHCITPLLPVLI